jgi:hypothetical protein
MTRGRLAQAARLIGLAASTGCASTAHKLEGAVSVAAAAARQCPVDTDAANVNVSRDGSNYRFEFHTPGERGDSATITVDRCGLVVGDIECGQ